MLSPRLPTSACAQGPHAVKRPLAIAEHSARVRLRTNSWAAFTLIELLVVIFIIIVLAALLLPVFAKAEEKAKQASCSSNMQSLAHAFALYRADHDGRQPPEVSGLPGSRYLAYWPYLINTYARNRGLFNCPSKPKIVWSGRPDDTTVCYGLNFLYMNGRVTEYGGMESLVWEPEDTILLVESDQYVAADPQSNGGAYAVAGIWGRIAPRHNETLNVAYVDGHVKVRRKCELCNWRRWDACHKPYNGEVNPPLEGNCPP